MSCRFTLFVCLSLSLCSCTTYRSAHQGYRGLGEYKVATDYTDYNIPKSEVTHLLPYRPSSAFQVTWPVRNIKINRGYRPASDRRHEGVDLGGKKGHPILAAHEGVVIYTGNDFRGYGNMVLVEFNDEWASLYAHLDAIDVRPGQIVAQGTSLGGMGRTGHASGVHLHFELLHKRKPVNPLPYLSRSQRVAGRQ